MISVKAPLVPEPASLEITLILLKSAEAVSVLFPSVEVFADLLFALSLLAPQAAKVVASPITIAN